MLPLALVGTPETWQRDGVSRTGALAPIDSQGRAHLGKVLAALGWDQLTALVAVATTGEATVTRGTVATPAQLPLSIDKNGRLTLTLAVVGALRLATGDQVIAVAVPNTGELHLRSAADVLQTITGPLETPVAVPTARPGRAKAGVRPRLTAVPGGSGEGSL